MCQSRHVALAETSLMMWSVLCQDNGGSTLPKFLFFFSKMAIKIKNIFEFCMKIR